MFLASLYYRNELVPLMQLRHELRVVGQLHVSQTFQLRMYVVLAVDLYK